MLELHLALVESHILIWLEKTVRNWRKFGWSVKIETQGSGGVEFALTDEDINAADCVLIASDVAVSGTERFKGKPMVKVPVATAIKSPEHLLRKIEEKIRCNEEIKVLKGEKIC